MMGEIYLSVIIPAYNEGKRLPQTLEEVHHYLRTRDFRYEVIVASDGSKDATVEICRAWHERWPDLRVLDLPHRGKGATVKEGCLAARGDVVLVMDADHPTPIDSLDLMFPLMADYDMVVGVRAFQGAEGSSGRMRRIIGLIQQLLAHLIVFKKSVADSQCGFKVFSKKAVKVIFERLREKGGMYDVEMFCIAHQHDIKIFSKPVKWVNKEGSTINIPRCIIFDPWSLVVIKFNDLIGKYR